MMRSLRKLISWIAIVSLILLGLPVLPGAEAVESLTNVKDTISTSAPEATAVTHVFTFTTATSSDEIVFTFESDFFTNGGDLSDNLNDYTCPDGTAADSTSTNGFTCSGSFSAGTHTATATNAVNPQKQASAGVADTYQVLIENKSGGTVLEHADAMFAIIEQVTVSATVEATLTFTISGTSSGVTVNGATTTINTTTTTIPFGTLQVGTPAIGAQKLTVATNASEGFTVVVFQDQDLTSAAGDTIHCFDDGSCVDYTSAKAWESPSGVLDSTTTYGHFGLTSQDESLGSACDQDYFGDNLWAGFSGTSQVEVMRHCGPSDGSTEHKGATVVGYQVEITALQPAGEYTNTLTYIATPTY